MRTSGSLSDTWDHTFNALEFDYDPILTGTHGYSSPIRMGVGFEYLIQ